MRAEVSCLFHLEYHNNVVKEAHVGSGVYLQELVRDESLAAWMKEVLKDDLLKAQQKLNWGRYTHRFYISLEDISSPEDSRIEQAQQLLIRAIVLSRIVQPVPIATGGPWVITIYPDSAEPYHLPEIPVGFFSKAYTMRPHFELTFTHDDASRLVELWPNLQLLFDNEEKYRRLIRALKYFDGGYHMYLAEFRHIIFCAAIESLICTQPDLIKAQFAQRLPQLIPGITEKQAITIYNLSNDLKHRAAPLQLKTIDDIDDDDVVADNQERLDAVAWAEKSLRLLLQQSLSDRGFADLLANREEFVRQYPIELKKSSIGDFIIRDKEVRGGRAIIAGTGITVHRIASWYRLGLRPEEIAGRIGHLSLAEIYAALAHYHANRDQIDDEIAAEEAEADRLEREHYLSLQNSS